MALAASVGMGEMLSAARQTAGGREAWELTAVLVAEVTPARITAGSAAEEAAGTDLTLGLAGSAGSALAVGEAVGSHQLGEAAGSAAATGAAISGAAAAGPASAGACSTTVAA